MSEQASEKGKGKKANFCNYFKELIATKQTKNDGIRRHGKV